MVLDTKQQGTLFNISILFSFNKIVFLSRLTTDYLSELCQESEGLTEKKNCLKYLITQKATGSRLVVVVSYMF